MFACQPQPVFPILYMPSINCVSYSLWSSVAIACVTLFIPVCLFLNIPWPLYHCLRFTCVPVYPSLRLNFYPSLCLFVNPSLCYPGYPSLPYLHACPSLCVLACFPVFSSLSSCVSYNVFLCVLQCVPVHPTLLLLPCPRMLFPVACLSSGAQTSWSCIPAFVFLQYISVSQQGPAGVLLYPKLGHLVTLDLLITVYCMFFWILVLAFLS